MRLFWFWHVARKLYSVETERAQSFLFSLFHCFYVSQYGIFSGPYFSVFGPGKTPYLETFHAVFLLILDSKVPEMVPKFLKKSHLSFLEIISNESFSTSWLPMEKPLYSKIFASEFWLIMLSIKKLIFALWSWTFTCD